MTIRIYQDSDGTIHREVVRAGQFQNLSIRYVQKGILEGWISAGNGKLIIHTEPLLQYRILALPTPTQHFYRCEQVSNG